MEDEEGILGVKFYQKEIKNDFESKIAGRPIMFMTDFVRIEIPGDRNTIIDQEVNESHKDRFPRKWMQYLNAKTEGKLTGDYQGTPIKEWGLLEASKAEELKHFKFYTVEQLASASDEQINNLGMAAGMAPHVLREKAKAYLNKATDSAYVEKQAEELANTKAELDALKAQVAELLQVKKGGRPPKQELEAA